MRPPIMTAIGDPITVSANFGEYEGDVTVSVIDGSGNVVIEEAAATPPQEPGGSFTYELPVQTEPTLLEVKFSAADGRFRTQIAEVTGNSLFTDEQVRSLRVAGMPSPLSNVADYPASVIAHWRALITELFETRTERGWVSRWCRVELRGSGTRSLNLANGEPRTSSGLPLRRPGCFRTISKVRRVIANGKEIDPKTITIDGRRLIRHTGAWPTSPNGSLNIVVEYEYGDVAVSWEATENGLRMIAANAAPSAVDSRATSFSNEDGTFRISTYPTAVEEWLRSQTLWSPLV